MHLVDAGFLSRWRRALIQGPLWGADYCSPSVKLSLERKAQHVSTRIDASRHDVSSLTLRVSK